MNYAYDRFGRVIQDGELSYDHDKNGNRVEIGYPGGVAATYTYDFADRPSTLDVQVGAGPVQPVVTSSSYLPSGPLASLGLGNGTTETRALDGRYAPVEILLDAPNPHRWSYVTDGVGNVTEITETTGCVDADLVLENQTITTTETFENCTGIEAGPAFSVESPGDVTFTAGTRVVLKDGFSVGSGARFVAGVDPSQAPVVETKSFTYQDIQYFLTGADLPWSSLSWTYDRIGNRLTETRDGVTDTYVYAANGTGGNTAILDQVTLGAGGTRDYTFGAAGHLEQVDLGANVVDFTSDAEGRLSQVSRAGGETSPFTYDGRSFLTEAGDLSTVGTTRPVYSSDGLVMALHHQASSTDPELMAVVLYFAGRPVAQIEIGRSETRWWYFTTDHLGTPQVATDEEETEIWSSRLEPFGEDAVRGTPEGALANNIFLRLPGQWETDTWQDAALGAGVYYNVHRWYQPGIGRYGRPDPLGLGDGVNNYLYVRGNPLLLGDLLGLFCTTDFVKRYFRGDGSPLDLNDVGLLNDFRNSPSVRHRVRDFQRSLFKKMVKEIRRVCRGCQTQKSGQVFDADSAPVDVTTQPCLFSIGNTALRRKGTCGFSADCQARTFSFACGFVFGIGDDFKDPLDIFDWFPGNIEVPGGKPYDINARWTENDFGSGNF